MTLAVFDIDGTLVAGPSTEKRFFLWLARRGLLGPRQLIAFLLFNLRWLPRFGRHVAKKNKAYLTGLETERLREESRQFVTAEVIPALFAPAVKRLHQHQSAGDPVILLSGTLQPIADALGDYLGADEVIGSLCSRRDGRITWRPPTRHPFAAAKAELLADLCARYASKPAAVAAYGDSGYDLSILGLVGTPVAVRPDKPLQSIARQRGWEVLTDDGRHGVGGTSRDTA